MPSSRASEVYVFNLTKGSPFTDLSMASKPLTLKTFYENKGQIQETRNPDYCDYFISKAIKAIQVHKLSDQLESYSVGL